MQSAKVAKEEKEGKDHVTTATKWAIWPETAGSRKEVEKEADRKEKEKEKEKEKGSKATAEAMDTQQEIAQLKEKGKAKRMQELTAWMTRRWQRNKRFN